MAVSVDGYAAKPDGDLGWIFPGFDDALRSWVIESLSETDTQLIGGINYQEQAQFWPTSTDELAPLINGSLKIVFSSSLKTLEWNNSRLAEAAPAQVIAELKQQPGKHIYVTGGAGLARSLSSQGLIDEYRLMVQPVVLGSGLPLFQDQIDLKLLDTKVFGTGALVLIYEPTAGKE